MDRIYAAAYVVGLLSAFVYASLFSLELWVAFFKLIWRAYV